MVNNVAEYYAGIPPINWVNGVWTVPSVAVPAHASALSLLDSGSPSGEEFRCASWVGIDGTPETSPTSAPLLQAGVTVFADGSVEPWWVWIFPTGLSWARGNTVDSNNGDQVENHLGISVSPGDTLHVYLEAFSTDRHRTTL